MCSMQVYAICFCGVCCRINNCVGEENQFAFMLMLLYTFLLSLATLAVSIIYFVLLEDCITCTKVIFFQFSSRYYIYIAFSSIL